MKYYRSTWQGQAVYTSLSTGQLAVYEERVVIVQAFDRKGLMHGCFKVAYLDRQGNTTLKLALTNRMEGTDIPVPWHECDDGPFRLATTTNLNLDHNTLVGDLDVPYDYPTAGQIQIWTLKPFQPYQTWNYDNYWGNPVKPVFDPPLAEVISVYPGSPVKGMRFYIDGWGHATKTHLVRTMVYATGQGDAKRKLYMKSSSLVLARQEIQDGKCFERFA